VDGARESKVIGTQVRCTNVPKRPVTVADALAALKAAALAPNDARVIRRTLLEVLAALEDAE
jgi:hypothetical protein